MVIPLVVGVLLRCHPPAIFLFIIRIHVDPVQLKSGGVAILHIRHKVSNILLPPVADPDPSAAIVMVICVFRIVASAFHPFPDAPEGSAHITMPGGFHFSDFI